MPMDIIVFTHDSEFTRWSSRGKGTDTSFEVFAMFTSKRSLLYGKIIQLGSLATTKFNHEERELIFMTRSILKTTENQSKALKKLIKIGFRLAPVSRNGHVRIGHSLMGVPSYHWSLLHLIVGSH